MTPKLVQEHGLTVDEYARIKEILGREPTYTELGIFSVMWSEHCSYKNTKPLLKRFPTKSPRILVGAGEENAGIVDIGDGLAIAFKIESHNHPSAVEPFQGAATGVGGIIRDIFTMGARPVCAVNSLRFGPISEDTAHPALSPHPTRGEGGRRPGEGNSAIANRESQITNNQRLFSGVVAGIAHYGNCFGIPTIAGEVYFDKTYQGNPLVNAFCLGVLRHEQIARGAAKGIGNPVFYVGPATGRDGLAGAAFASQDLTEESAEQQRGAVQVADPFMEKLVCEACLELLATGAVAGMQDMGAAGLTCSTCETAARAGTGIEIELSKVPQRAPNMTPYEIMLSESQERMLVIVQRGREDEVKRIFDKWDLPWSQIGFVTDTGRMVVKNRGQTVADIPARQLANEAPIYHRQAREPAYLKAVREFPIVKVRDTTNPLGDLKRLLSWPSIASKNWVYRQYDHTVRACSVIRPGSDAAVLRLKEDSLPPVPKNPQSEISPSRSALRVGGRNPQWEKFLALTVDCNAAYVYLDPFEGSKIAVAEAARNLACAGATPLGLTDNLNFGNPHNPEIFYQLKSAVEGLAEACRAFDVPVTGGNVSLYNQSPAGPVDPTPTVAMAGLIEKPEHITTQWFKAEGDAILLLGQLIDSSDPLLGLGGSAYFQSIHGLKTGLPPRCDLVKEKNLHDALRALIRAGLIQSAHDCSEGGLAVTLAECCLSQQVARDTPRLVGAQIDLTGLISGGRESSRTPASDSKENQGASGASPSPIRLDALLFGEAQSRVIISVKESNIDEVLDRARQWNVPASRLGTVGGDALKIRIAGRELTWDLRELHDLWWNSIARVMK